MRVWAEVYQDGAKVAFIEFVSANTTVKLDEAGSFDLACTVSADVLTYLIRDNEVAIWSQEDEESPRLELWGVIIKPRVQESGDSISISISGRDLMEELRRVTVGLGKTYNAETMQAIMNDLTSMVTGWIASVETASASRLQAARFDGPKVLKAALKSADQMGLHVRSAQGSRVLEVGAFGDYATTPSGERIYAMQAASSIPPEAYSNDAVLFVDSISLTEDGDSLVNWAIPMGAGTGSAATTLSYTTYEILNSDNTVYRAGVTPDFPIYRRVNDAGIAEYYIDASDGETQHQDTLSFKEIGPIANSLLAKQLASDALAIACFESLRRTRTPIISYSLTVRKQRVTLQPGDLIRLRYKGRVPTAEGDVVYIDVDEDLWVMGISRSLSDSGFTTTLTVNTIDQKIKDDTDILVDVVDRSEVNNLSIQTFPFGFHDSSERVMAGSSNPTYQRDAEFSLQIPDLFTDVIRVTLHLITRPLYTLTDVGTYSVPSTPYASAIGYNYTVYKSTNYPSDVSLKIDGTDVTTALGGPWNSGAGNSPIDVELDISSYIIDAAGGLYENHTLTFFSTANKTADIAVQSGSLHPSASSSLANNGIIECKILLLGNARSVF